MIGGDLRIALQAAAAAMEAAADPWWVIGSAAVALHGVDPGPVSDIDLLTSARDGAMLLERAGVPNVASNADRRFRSAIFGRWPTTTLPIEVMGGLQLRESGGWTPLIPETRELAMLGDARLWLPARAEMIDILHRFGRDKDLRRAALLAGSPPLC